MTHESASATSGQGRKKRALCVVGTRPEAIKMAPIIKAMEKEPWMETRVLATAQHREMLDEALSLFGITPQLDLDIMRPNQTLVELSSRLILKLDEILASEQPDAVLAEGDTTTVLITALACFYRRIPFFHVEAGLRTGQMYYPFPEEMNRVLASRIAALHFAPTEAARRNLLSEGVPDEKIFVTQNTVIDALLMVAGKDIQLGVELDPLKRMILVTLHRRENFGQPVLEICEAIKDLARMNMDIEFLVPVHPNPNVSNVISAQLGKNPQVKLVKPLSYGVFVSAMKRSYLILTDSGGVQEEAPALGKPALVLRNETERPEAVLAGTSRLVGANRETIVSATQALLDSKEEYETMVKGVSPFGDGKASERIIAAMRDFFAVK